MISAAYDIFDLTQRVDPAQPIDWENPLTRGLRHAFIPAARRDLLQSADLEPAGAPTLVFDAGLGSAWRLDGMADYLVAQNRVKSASAKTIAFWCIGDGNGDRFGIVASVHDSFSGQGYVLHLWNSFLRYSCYGVAGQINYNFSPTANTPYLCVVTTEESNSNCRLYLNASLVDSGSLGVNAGAEETIYLGTYSAERIASGWHGPTFVWDRPLSAAEVWQLYAAQTRWSMLRVPHRSSRTYALPWAAPAPSVSPSFFFNQFILRRAR